MPNRQNDPDAGKISYLVRCSDGDFIIEIDPAWKVTFGAINPSAKEGYNDRSLHCLRVYEGEKVRAVFCNVKGFRDLSIPFARKVEKETGSASWSQDSTGNFEKSEMRQVETSYEGNGIVPEDIPF